VNFTANSFSTALCRCGVLSKIVATVFLLEGVKTASVGTCAVGTCIEGVHELEFVELGTPVTEGKVVGTGNLSSIPTHSCYPLPLYAKLPC